MHSYHPSFTWTKTLHEGIISGLDESSQEIRISVEYMDTKRIVSQEHLDGLVSLFEAKYGSHPPDLIISADNAAFSMLYKHRRQIFGKDVPVVFTGVNEFDSAQWPGMKNILGVDEVVDFDAMAALLHRIHPGYRRVALVVDGTVTGQAYRNGFLQWASTHPDGSRFYIPEDEGPTALIVDCWGENPPEMLLYLVYAQGPQGQLYDPEDLFDRFVQETGLPIYGFHDYQMGRGLSGGPIVDVFESGKKAAELALEVLEEQKTTVAFQLVETPQRMQFDYRRLRDLGISVEWLPPGSSILYQPEIFWHQYPWESFFGLITFLIMTIGLFFSLRLVRQRDSLLRQSREAVELLRLNERRLETLLILNDLDQVSTIHVIEKAMDEAAVITGSCYAVAWYRELPDGDGHTYVLDVRSSDEPRFYRGPPGIPVGILEAERPGERTIGGGEDFFIGGEKYPVHRGLVYSCHPGSSDVIFSLAVFNKESLYVDGDRRQLDLMVEGAWRILARHRSDRRLRELNTELEERVRRRSEELHLAEVELIRSEKQAALGALVAGIAHEVNTPLGLAVTGGSFLRDQFSLISQKHESQDLSTEEFQEFMITGMELGQSLVMNLQRAALMIRNFKQVAVDQTGEKPRLLELQEFAQELSLSLRSELKRAHAQLESQAPEGVTLLHYPGDLWRVLSNLVMNSIKHGFIGQDGGKISVEFRDLGHDVSILYQDNGKGIPSQDLARIFDPFFTTARDSGGTGLGLHLVRAIIEDRHGGKVDVQSTGLDGQGVGFLLIFPKTSPALKDESMESLS
ncbi:MAG: sensor histidine kinase [Spirochaetales bacterium]|nr:sensor histidine kinase [Spirochaetales bacterium]